MANRRMFSKQIISTAKFLRMPSTTRLLYYDLGMQADDDGFVESFAVIRMTGASEDDLRLLDAKGFIKIVNDDLTVWIVDWSKNNQIRSDRYTKSEYNELLPALTGIPNVTQTETTCHQDGNHVETDGMTTGKPSIGKVSIVKESKGKAKNTRKKEECIFNEVLFSKFWILYPRKQAKQDAIKAWNALEPDEEFYELTIEPALKKQIKSDQWTKDNGKFISLPASWIRGKRWEDETFDFSEKPKKEEVLGVGPGWW